MRAVRTAFSLIEVMVSGVLLIVGLAAALSVYGTVANQQNHTTHRSTAGVIAEAALEDLVLRYPSDAALTLGEHPDQRFFALDGSRLSTSTNAIYVLGWRVSHYSKLQAIREVTANVAWRDAMGAHELELTTWRD